eukprot:TRINITY_DN56_c0_g1_i7.p1 TRINITY_DN56_c0_g1~~TRINITY_DN56_c0_g1_i7.p1  ORF type:complete len:204 (+),score=1.15 TRINITY_DN56_c0_g1_i7:1135-1746(+)
MLNPPSHPLFPPQPPQYFLASRARAGSIFSPKSNISPPLDLLTSSPPPISHLGRACHLSLSLSLSTRAHTLATNTPFTRLSVAHYEYTPAPDRVAADFSPCLFPPSRNFPSPAPLPPTSPPTLSRTPFSPRFTLAAAALFAQFHTPNLSTCQTLPSQPFPHSPRRRRAFETVPTCTSHTSVSRTGGSPPSLSFSSQAPVYSLL